MSAPSERRAEAGEAGRSWWSVAAVACFAAGVVLFLAGRAEWAFAAGVVGVLSWFLNLRGAMQRRNEERMREREQGDEDEDDDEVASDEDEA